jgi:hypothetical protein
MRRGEEVARDLVAKLHEAVFARQDQERQVGIVIDEAQRFLTNDPETGEQSFLGRCREFRCLTLLATQLRKSEIQVRQLAFSAVGARHRRRQHPSKFIFRTTASDTLNWLRNQVPLFCRPLAVSKTTSARC